MSRVQLALRVPDLHASIAFYSKLFGVEPAKLRDGYANFAITEPPLKLVLVQGTPDENTRMGTLSPRSVRTAGAWVMGRLAYVSPSLWVSAAPTTRPMARAVRIVTSFSRFWKPST